MREAEALTHAERVVAHALPGRRAVEADEVEQAVDAARVDAHHLRGDNQRLASAATVVLRCRVEQDPDAAAGIGKVAIATAEDDRLSGVRLRQP